MKTKIDKVALRVYAAAHIMKSQLESESKHQILNFLQHEASDAQVATLILDGKISRLNEHSEQIAIDRFICSKHYDKVLEQVKIPIKNPGELEVPEGKGVENLSLGHFQALVKKKGYSPIVKALTNLIVWNKTKNPTLSKWADSMQNRLKSWADKERESNPEFGK